MSELKIAVRELLAILETEEESSSGHKFHPTTLSSCRVMTTVRLESVLMILKELSR